LTLNIRVVAEPAPAECRKAGGSGDRAVDLGFGLEI